MFDGACWLSKFVEDLVGSFLEAEVSSSVWNVKETTLTDIVVAAFRSANLEPLVSVDASIEETTNADLELVLRHNGQDLTLLMQAKRGKRTKRGFSYPELFHPGSSGAQSKGLINYCKTRGYIPLYCFFLPNMARRHIESAIGRDNSSNILLQSAEIVRKRGFTPPGKNNKRGIDLHSLDAIPFRNLFCQWPGNSELGELIRDINDDLIGIRSRVANREPEARKINPITLSDIERSEVFQIPKQAILESIPLEDRKRLYKDYAPRLILILEFQ